MIRAAVAALLAMSSVAEAAPPWTLDLRAADEAIVAAGAVGAVSLTVVPPSGRTLSLDGAFLVELSAGEGLGLPRRRYVRRDAVDPAAEAPRFDLRVRGAAPGDHPLRIEVRAWLCGAKVCRPVRAERTVVVHVSAS